MITIFPPIMALAVEKRRESHLSADKEQLREEKAFITESWVPVWHLQKMTFGVK